MGCNPGPTQEAGQGVVGLFDHHGAVWPLGCNQIGTQTLLTRRRGSERTDLVPESGLEFGLSKILVRPGGFSWETTHLEGTEIKNWKDMTCHRNCWVDAAVTTFPVKPLEASKPLERRG